MAASAFAAFKQRIRGNSLQRAGQDGTELLAQGPASPDGTGSHRMPLSDEATGVQAQPGGNRAWWGRGALSVFEKSNPHKGIDRFGIPLLQTIKHYIISDPFTTLLNAPAGRFIAVFFALYLAVYLFFACVFMLFPIYCTMDTSKHFGRMFWFSFQTASTIGYAGDLYPNPDCDFFNLIVMVEIIFAALLDYCLMGAVFARFAAPLPKAQSIRFSANALLCRPAKAGGLWTLSFRMANIRKHSLLKPEICLLLAIPEGPHDPSNSALCFKDLQVTDVMSQTTNLRLGLPVIVEHLVTPSSPLFDLSLSTMETRGMELICFLDGMDPMTSNSVQARHSYRPADIRMNEVFSAIGLQANWRGEMGLDFTQFDKTVPDRSARSTESGDGGEEIQPIWGSTGGVGSTDPGAASTSKGPDHQAVQEYSQELRSQTLRSLSLVPEDGRDGVGSSQQSPATFQRQQGIAAGPRSQAADATAGRRGAGGSSSPPGDPLGVMQGGQAPAPGNPPGPALHLGPQVMAFLGALMADGAVSVELRRAAQRLCPPAAAPVRSAATSSTPAPPAGDPAFFHASWPRPGPDAQQQQQQQQQSGSSGWPHQQADWQQQQLPVSSHSTTSLSEGGRIGAMHGAGYGTPGHSAWQLPGARLPGSSTTGGATYEAGGTGQYRDLMEP